MGFPCCSHVEEDVDRANDNVGWVHKYGNMIFLEYARRGVCGGGRGRVPLCHAVS